MNEVKPGDNTVTTAPSTEKTEQSLSAPDPSDLPPIQTEPISAVFPLYNDQVGLEKGLAQWTNQLDGLRREYEILLVDDASTDSTVGLAESLAEKFPRVRLLRHEKRRGFGRSLRTGLEAARYPLVLISTCDGQYQPANLERFFKWIDKVHLVCAYRTVDSRRYKRNWAERLYHLLIRIILGLRLKDAECWFLLARRSIFARIPIQSEGPIAFAEVLAKANFLTCLMAEVPVTYQPSLEAAAKWSAVTLRQKLAGFRRVFSQSDFGPPKLPET